MSQFRPLPTFQAVQTTEMAEEQLREILHTPSIPNTTPLICSDTPCGCQGPLTNISYPLPVVTAEQLRALSGPLSVTSTTGRIIRIPGSRVRKQRTTPVTEELPKPTRWMKPHLRHGFVVATILLVVITTMLYLTPLSNGQSGGSLFFKGISDWVHAEQTNWQFQAHNTQVVQNDQNNSLPPPPPVVLPKSAYVAVAQQDAINAGISPDYFTRQIYLESGFNPNAVSPSGAVGIAQFLPGTAAGLGVNPWDPYSALNGAAKLMASYNRSYGGNYAMALAAYNGGGGTVQYAVNACGASNWMNCLPYETRNYIRAIMGI
jgi:hypothetical protein